MSKRSLTWPSGFRVAAVRAGIKAGGTLDLGLIAADELCNAAAVFTTNKVVAPAVVVNRERIRSGRAQAVFVNAGNANACTGARGLRDVHTICNTVAKRLDISPDAVLVCSTGIIGAFLPITNVREGIGRAADALSGSARAGSDLAQAIMTTDTKPKMASCELNVNRVPVRIAGTAKGSGMIAPNMATMLAFVTTDANISSAALQRAMTQVTDRTFNKVTIDNHMSTSDTAIVLASGRAGNKRIVTGANYERFAEGLWRVCDDLARQMAADGEGAGCAITIRVMAGRTPAEAHAALRAIADSPLVRCAFAGADPNWGRIVSAVGYSGARFDETGLSCRIAGVLVFRAGRPAPFDAKRLSRKMKARQWTVEVNLGAGRFDDFCYTCDLTQEYVSINADYHT